MSVVLECQQGDAVFCIQAFHASPDGDGFSWDMSRHFRVGERLVYRGSRQDPNNRDRPNAWVVIVEASDHKRYAAAQTYFVTEDCWTGIKNHFAKRLLREPKRKRVP